MAGGAFVRQLVPQRLAGAQVQTQHPPLVAARRGFGPLAAEVQALLGSFGVAGVDARSSGKSARPRRSATTSRGPARRPSTTRSRWWSTYRAGLRSRPNPSTAAREAAASCRRRGRAWRPGVRWRQRATQESVGGSGGRASWATVLIDLVGTPRGIGGGRARAAILLWRLRHDNERDSETRIANSGFVPPSPGKAVLR